MQDLSLPPPFFLRAIGEQDQAFLDALYRSTREDLAQMPADPAFVAELIGMQQHMQTQGLRSSFPQAQYGIVERDGQAIGRLVYEAAPGRLHLADLALLADARGQGAGSVVLRALQACAAQRGVPLSLSVSHANPGAVRLYARLGFVVSDSNAMQQSMAWRAPTDLPA